MADISQIKLPNGDIFDLVDESKSTATNWVNGSQTGSVRTINSKAEDSSYTIGLQAVAEGSGTKATGKYSHAEGGGTTASGTGSHAEGSGTQAKGVNSHAEGGGAIANGSQSHAEGSVTTAGGPDSHAEGNYTTASGDASHAEGGGTQASGQYSHAEGASTVASNNKDHAEGYQTTASGGCAHAEGYGTVASGLDSHAEGDSTIANHLAQHVFGQYNIADTSTATTDNKGKYVEIVGNGSYNARSNARTLDWSGNEVLAGKLTVGVAGTNSLDVATIGQLPTKTSDLTNDSNFISDSAYIHTDNNYTTIEKNKLNGIAEGAEANVNADWNENDSTSASYIQNRPFYLEEDAEVVIFEGDVAFSKNYNTINWDYFNYSFSERIAVGTPVILTIDDIVLNTAVELEGSSSYFIGIKDPGDSTRADTNHIGLTLNGSNDSVSGIVMVLALASMVSTGTHHVKLAAFVDVYHKIDNHFIDLEIENGSGLKSVQQKGGALANGDYSSAFGLGTVASPGSYAHAEGKAWAVESYAHAEGLNTKAQGQAAHAEGSSTTASTYFAHAEGYGTTASGQAAHAEGYYTTSKNRSQHVFGEFNIADPSTASANSKGNYVEIVGNGTGISALSNARTLDWSGNEVLAGKLTVGAVGVNSMDVATVGQLSDYVVTLTESWAYEATEATYTWDKTFAEIKAAIDAKKNVILYMSSNWEDEEGTIYGESTKYKYEFYSYQPAELEDGSDWITFTTVSSASDGYIDAGTISLSADGSVDISTGSVTTNTDERLAVSTITKNLHYYPIMGTSPNAQTRQFDQDGFRYIYTAGGYACLKLGNETASGNTGSKAGVIELYGTGIYYGTLRPGPVKSNSLTANRSWQLPDKDGTIALTSDISTYTAGTGIDITNGVISVNLDSAEGGTY